MTVAASPVRRFTPLVLSRLSRGKGVEGAAQGLLRQRRWRLVGPRAWLLGLCFLVVLLPCAARATADTVPVRLGDREVFELPSTPSMLRRARAAEAVLDRAAHSKEPQPVVVKSSPQTRTIYVGKAPLIELTERDRELAERAELRAYADEIAARVESVLRQERQRNRIAERVLAVSTVVFLAVLAWILLRLTRSWSRAASRWAYQSGKKVGPLRFDTVELLPAAAVREAIRVAIVGGTWLTRVIIVYSWALVSLSLFAATRHFAQRATGYLLAPVAELLERMASKAPVVVALLFALLLVALVLRFVTTYFRAVERGEVDTEVLRPETAKVTGTLVSLGIALSALLFAAPLLTGSSDGVLNVLGVLGIAVVALSTTPLLASCALGIRLAYGRAVRPGDQVEYGGQSGVVQTIALFDLVLCLPSGATVRVPHLMTLWHPTRILRPPSDRKSSPPVSVLPPADRS